MVYVHRDNSDKIIKLTARPNGSEEHLPIDDPEVIAFNITHDPSIEEVYDKTIQSNKLIKALVVSLNDGSFVPGNSLSGSELKSIIISKM